MCQHRHHANCNICSNIYAVDTGDANDGQISNWVSYAKLQIFKCQSQMVSATWSKKFSAKSNKSQLN